LALPELPALLAEARKLTGAYQAGGAASFYAYRDLLSLLFSITVMDKTGGIQIAAGSGRPERGVMAPLGGPVFPLPLTDGHFLRFNINLFLGETEKVPGLEALKVEDENYQYQLDTQAQQWVFRYEYKRERADRHPPAHLHIRAALLSSVDILGLERPLERLHFPTGRVSVPGLIRLLIEQFKVPANRSAGVWRRVLSQTERDFQRIAHQTLSGPEA
jgi:hypothetical protein